LIIEDLMTLYEKEEIIRRVVQLQDGQSADRINHQQNHLQIQEQLDEHSEALDLVVRMLGALIAQETRGFRRSDLRAAARVQSPLAPRGAAPPAAARFEDRLG
jgi:hypothetical protein